VRVLGMISGTSHDGIDAALVEFEPRKGVLHGTVLDTATTPYEAGLRDALRRTLPPAELQYADVCRLDTLIGQAFAEVAAAAIARGGPVDLICSHGQTVYHWVDGLRALGTLQLGQPRGRDLLTVDRPPAHEPLATRGQGPVAGLDAVRRDQ